MSNKITQTVISYEQRYGNSIVNWQPNIVIELQQRVHQLEEEGNKDKLIKDKLANPQKYEQPTKMKRLLTKHEQRHRLFNKDITNMQIAKRIFNKPLTKPITTKDKNFFYMARLIVDGKSLPYLVQKGFSLTNVNNVFSRVYKTGFLFIGNKSEETVLSDSQNALKNYLLNKYNNKIASSNSAFIYAINKGNNIGEGIVEPVSIILPIKLLDKQGNCINEINGQILAKEALQENGK